MPPILPFLRAHPPAADQARDLPLACATKIKQIRECVGEIVLDKDHTVQLLLAGLLSGGHVLIEDCPGVGKTTLAQSLARAMGLQFNRVQFTSDLLPTDITGGSIYDRNVGEFKFLPGPVFSQVLLADEINRASPKTQSALLEAMEERRVTIDGITHVLPDPFLVIATQNPSHHTGTFALPESQLDRFAININVGYPSERAEIQLITGQNTRAKLAHLTAAVNPAELQTICTVVQQVIVTDDLARYIRKIACATRDGQVFHEGLSPRSLIALTRTCRAWAVIHGDSHVTPDHVRDIYPWVAAHRLTPLNEGPWTPGPSSAPYHANWLQSIPCES